MEITPARLLDRGNTRDAVLLACLTAIVVRPQPGSHGLAAGALLAAGSLLHIVVKGTLIRNTTLCQTGPYRLCRHPYYLANFMVDSAFCLLTGNPYVLALLPFLFFWGYGPSLRSEEQRLLDLHGGAYLRFAAATPALFPDSLAPLRASSLTADFSLQRLTRNERKRVLRFWGAFLGMAALQAGLARAYAGTPLALALRSPAVLASALTALTLLLAAALVPRRRAGAEAAVTGVRPAPAPVRPGVPLRTKAAAAVFGPLAPPVSPAVAARSAEARPGA